MNAYSAVDDSYVYLTDIASGGMGKVELVMRKEGTFERFYARKRLHSSLEGAAGFRDMFLDEARIAGHLRHANIVSVLDVGEDAEGPFMLMDYVDGLSLGEVLTMYAERQALVPLQVGLRIVLDAARGLHAAHEAKSTLGKPLNIVHRDISPSNIMLGFDGSVRITDFGVAKAFGRLVQTQTGGIKGKLSYMSPEQIQSRPMDRRSDLFSLGIVLGELLSGTSLYAGPLGPSKIVDEPPPDLTELREGIPDAAMELFFQLLAKDPKLRPASAKEVEKRLAAVLSQLAAEEGTETVSDFLDTHFSVERERRAACLASAARRFHEATHPHDGAYPAHESSTRAIGDADTIATTGSRSGARARERSAAEMTGVTLVESSSGVASKRRMTLGVGVAAAAAVLVGAFAAGAFSGERSSTFSQPPHGAASHLGQIAPRAGEPSAAGSVDESAAEPTPTDATANETEVEQAGARENATAQVDVPVESSAEQPRSEPSSEPRSPAAAETRRASPRTRTAQGRSRPTRTRVEREASPPPRRLGLEYGRAP